MVARSFTLLKLSRSFEAELRLLRRAEDCFRIRSRVDLKYILYITMVNLTWCPTTCKTIPASRAGDISTELGGMSLEKNHIVNN